MGLQATPDDPAAVEALAAALAFYDNSEKAIGAEEWLAGHYSYADIAFARGAPVLLQTLDVISDRTRLDLQPNSELAAELLVAAGTRRSNSKL